MVLLKIKGQDMAKVTYYNIFDCVMLLIFIHPIFQNTLSILEKKIILYIVT